jgi:hypothetical protein
MTNEKAAVTAEVETEMARIADERLATELRSYLVEPRPCLLPWDYGHPHPEFPEPSYPAFIVAEFPESGTGIAFSRYGFGPAQPWGLVWLDRLGYGMDSGWYARLEGAFRESMAWSEPAPPGYEVE